MKIGIDANPLLDEKKTGIGWYAYNLIKNIEKVDKENIYILFSNSLSRYKKKYEIKKNFKSKNFYVSIRPFPFLVWNYVVAKIFPFEFLYGNLDLIHTLHVLTPIPLSFHVKQVITIHDLIPLINLNLCPTESLILKIIIPKAVKKADMIITVSYNTKKDLLNHFKIDSEKITVIYPGLHHENIRPIEDYEKIEDLKKKYGIYGKYLLFVGAIEPKKNIPKLIDAFIIVKEKFPELKLVLCGKIGWKAEIFYKKMKDLPEKIKKDIILTGYVPVSDLPYLYNGCEVFVFPSLYEGFGSPVVEAMGCGVPVVTSNISSLPEVVGDAGILVNPENKEEIAEAILSILTDQNLKKTLSKKGIERAKLFSWENTAKKTLELYKKVVQK
ncbi:MAG: glycosyltransferase family 4 protein [Candidatus Omnitrophica bacterium]|nr:glycosyltransferase family 4 protein [Candidatus Omnitrophota bacterium]